MKVLTLDANSNYKDVRPAVLAMGMFDGLHLGHMSLISESVKLSKGFSDKTRSGSAVLTFDIPPKKIFSQAQFAGKILSDNAKFHLINQAEVDFVYLMKFTEEIFSMTPEKFFYDILLKKINPKYIVIGFNYTFGKNKSGNAEVLRKLCNDNGIILKMIEPVCLEGEIVSTTNVKNAILSRDIDKAKRFLGRIYELEVRALNLNGSKCFQILEDIFVPPKEVYDIEIGDKIFKCTIKDNGIIELDKFIDINLLEYVKIRFI